jgi:hypothetical protein
MIDRSSEAASETPSAALQRLQHALDERGIAARVEERAALAIIVPRGVHDASHSGAPDDTGPAPASSLTSEIDGEPEMSRAASASAASAVSHPALLLDADVRQWLVQAALAAGFSHVALEIVPSDQSHAALPGRHPA